MDTLKEGILKWIKFFSKKLVFKTYLYNISNYCHIFYWFLPIVIHHYYCMTDAWMMSLTFFVTSLYKTNRFHVVMHLLTAIDLFSLGSFFFHFRPCDILQRIVLLSI